MEDDIVRFDRDFYAPHPTDIPPAEYHTMLTEEHKKKHRTDLSTLIGTMDVDLAQPNTELKDYHITNAKLANASKIASTKGVAEAQEYLYENGIEKTIVDNSRYGIMLSDDVNPTRHTLALRGMNPSDARDIYNASLQFSGSNESRVMANQMIDKVEAGGGQVEHISGFSMGGADALDIAMERGIDASVFDAPINPRHIVKNTTSLARPKSDIELIRNPKNVLSMGAGFRNVSMSPQYRVSVVPAVKDGLIGSHELMPNFGTKQLDEATMKAEQLVKASVSTAQSDTMVAMKEAMNQNKSFTEFYRELNSINGVPSNIDVDVDGIRNKLGSRVNKSALLVKMWEMIGGEFNQAEATHINATPATEMTQQIIADADIVQHLREGEVETAKMKAQDRLAKSIQMVNEDEVLNHPAVQNSVNETVQSALHPVNMMTGTISAFAGSTAMKYIDPSGSFGKHNEEGVIEHSAVSGGLTGITSDVLMKGLAGEGLLSASLGTIAVGTAAGAVVGEATRYGVEKGLDELGANEDTQESLSTIAGGITGGMAVAGATDLATIWSAMMLGGEIGATAGVPGLIVGAGLGAVFAGASYGLAKLNQVPAVSKVEHEVASGLKKGWKSFKKLF